VAKATEIRKGMVLNIDGDLFVVTDRQHVTPGNWRAMVQISIKSMKTNRVIQRRLRAEDEVEVAFLERRKSEYLYKDGPNYVFMDTETYDQFPLPAELVEDQMQFCLPNTQVMVTLHDGKPLGIDLPTAIVLKVTETAPGVKGDSVTNVFKEATLETGLIVRVPLFLKQGEYVKISTETGEFLERVANPGA
jgi:elongation factor P